MEFYSEHSRNYRGNKFVYPVLSRRSRGISIGINLNPDKVCNFDCIYCQVDRRSEAVTTFVETSRLLAELDAMLAFVAGGGIFRDGKFADVPEPLRRLSDVAFSGDGEPTTYRNFDDIIAAAAQLKGRHGLDQVRMVLITNASMFHRPAVQRGLEILDENNGEIWAKLETGTEDYYRLVERTNIPFQRVLDNIAAAARQRPIVIQSLFMRVHGDAPPSEEIDAYCNRLNDISVAGGQIRLVQVYTVARSPAESYVSPLCDDDVDRIAARVAERTGLPVERHHG